VKNARNAKGQSLGAAVRINTLSLKKKGSSKSENVMLCHQKKQLHKR
jgi:hypothetical protein